MTSKLICGSCLSITQDLESESVDCTITSPPYNKQENKNSGRITKAVIYDSVSDSLPENQYQEQQVNLLKEIFRITKPGGHCFYNHKVRYNDGKAIFPVEWLSKTPWTIRQEIVWDRIIASNIRGWRFWCVDERIYWLYKPIDEKDRGIEIGSQWAKMTSIWRFRPEDKVKEHPAPFPKELPIRILQSLYEDGENKVIFDPYVGSGTTALVAKKLGHNYIGIDISEEYLKIAQKRIDGTERSNNVLESLFGE